MHGGVEKARADTFNYQKNKMMFRYLDVLCNAMFKFISLFVGTFPKLAALTGCMPFLRQKSV